MTDDTTRTDPVIRCCRPSLVTASEEASATHAGGSRVTWAKSWLAKIAGQVRAGLTERHECDSIKERPPVKSVRRP